MATVTIPLHVDPDGRVTGRVPSFVPPGNYHGASASAGSGREASLGGSRLGLAHSRPRRLAGRLSLHREDLYGEEGR